MATKRKKRISPNRMEDAKRVAAILATANIEGDRVTAAKFKVGERTIRRWRARAESGEWPELSDLASKVRDAALERCKDLLTDVYETGLRTLKDRMDKASYREVLDTVVETGGLKNVKDSLGDESSDQDTPADQGCPKAQGAASGDPPGKTAGASGLRVIR